MNVNIILHKSSAHQKKVMAATIYTKHVTPCTALQLFFQQAALQKISCCSKSDTNNTLEAYLRHMVKSPHFQILGVEQKS